MALKELETRFPKEPLMKYCKRTSAAKAALILQAFLSRLKP